MPPKTKRLFISYRTTDAAIVDKIAQDLRLLKGDDGESCYITWQDKYDLPAGVPNWWDAILDGIEACDMFIYHLTPDSLKSEVCKTELEYAHALNRPIIPIVLQSAYSLDPKSGGYRLLDELRALIPSWLEKRQWLFYVGADFYRQFQQAVNYYESRWPVSTSATRPLHPGGNQAYNHSIDLYEAACDYAYKLAFSDAKDLFRTLVQRNLPDFADAAAQWLEILRQYEELILIDSKPRSRFMFKGRWETYLSLFPKHFLEPNEIFNPKGFGTSVTLTTETAILTVITPPPAVIAPPKAIVKTRSEQLMPAPFAWIEIPAKGYSFAKYPVTNAQYAVFIDEGGYEESKWWTEEGLKWRKKENWTQPRLWKDSKWNGKNQPVVGISWYEAIAFARWIGLRTHEKIRIPTEDQWQYAAQGNDNRLYPWGDLWNCTFCNNSVNPCTSRITTPVTRFEGRGDSASGIVDMAGNILEWCLFDVELSDPVSVLRGGSWDCYKVDNFQCSCRDVENKLFRNFNAGFRLSRV